MDKKKLIWVFISLIIAGFSIWAVVAQSSSFSPEEYKSFLSAADKRYIFGALVSMFGFIFFEGLGVRSIAAGLGYKRNILQSTVYGAADVYFSAITPSASGGQPASAYFMIIDEIPAAVTTVVLLINLIMYTLAILFLGLFCFILRFDIFLNMSLLSKLLIGFGSVMLVLLVFAFYLLLKRAEIFSKICNGLLSFGEKIHIIKHGDKLRTKLSNTIIEYKNCSDSVGGKSSMLIWAFIWNFLQRVSQFFVAFFVFLASGQSLSNAVDVLITQCFVSLGSNCIPIPGAMGVADYIMLDGYELIVGEKLATYMELLSRGISFYGCMLISVIIVIVAFIINKVQVKKC